MYTLEIERLQVGSIFKEDFDSRLLRRLKSLTLTCLGIDTLQPCLCGALVQLTHLDLSENMFKLIPQGLSQLAALEELSFRSNHSLKLAPKDVEHLSALSKLTRLDLSKSYSVQLVWSGLELEVIWALCRRMPGLECKFTWGQIAFIGSHGE